MTEHRLFESAVGLAGRLSHIPYGTDAPENCGWRSSRILDGNAPVFRAIDSCRTWIPAEQSHAADLLPPSEPLWQQGRRQQNWLLRNHPEASLGNQALYDYLVEEDTSASLRKEHTWHTSFVSFGELTDTTLRRNPGIPLVVSITGRANDTLRLARIKQDIWTWPREPNVTARLSEMAMEKPTLWINDEVGPIRRVKCIVNSKSYNPIRWLAVQRDSGTTIFQPEYREIPEDEGLTNHVSQIAANPLFQLPIKQTGGNYHSDISFNPGIRSNPPQLAIIDERGVWSVWDVEYTGVKRLGKRTTRLRQCGHISHGILEQLPSGDHSEMRWHKVLWVGHSEDDMNFLGSWETDADDIEMGPQTAFPPLRRSSSLLIYNSQHIKVLDLTTGACLPDLAFCRLGSLDRILDVEVSRDSQYFYVLTTARLFVVRTYSKPGVEWDKPEKTWCILFSTPHFRSSFDRSLKLAVTQGAKSEQTASLVFVYSSTNTWIDVFQIEVSPTDANQVRCQASITRLRILQSIAISNAIQTLRINPVPIHVKITTSLTTTGRHFAKKSIALYEVAALRSDMSLVSIVCAYSSSSPSIHINVPSKRLAHYRISKRRKLMNIRRLSSNSIVDNTWPNSETAPLSSTHRYLKAFYEHIIHMSAPAAKENPTTSRHRIDTVYNLFDTAHTNVKNALTNGIIFPRTLRQIMPEVKDASRHSISPVNWEHEIERLDNAHPSLAIKKLDLQCTRVYSFTSLSLHSVYSSILELSTSSMHVDRSQDVYTKRLTAIVEEITYDLYLSLYSIRHRNSTSSQAEIGGEEGISLGSQTDTLPSSSSKIEAPASSVTLQTSNSEATENEDPAMVLLRAYTGTGKFVPEKKLMLLDKWQLDVDPSIYTFDLDRSGETGMSQLRKAKQAAREHRKRRRAETLSQLSQEPVLPATQPIPGTSVSRLSATQPIPGTGFFSSQPQGKSSQSRVIHSDPLRALSQPSAGSFGTQASKKVKKRKGGF